MDPFGFCFRRLPSGDKTFWHFCFIGGNKNFNYPPKNGLDKT